MSDSNKWFRDKFDKLNKPIETKSEEMIRRYRDLYSDVYLKDIDERIKNWERQNWNKLK